VTVQLSFFADEREPLEGLKVRLLDVCSCGSAVALIGAGAGPHCASLHCRCGKHRGWVSTEVYKFLMAVLKKFGRPSVPVVIRRRSTLPNPAYAGAPEGSQISARPEGDVMRRADLFPSKYLSAADLQGRPQVVVIESLSTEEVGDERRMKPVLRFKDRTKSLVLNATNYDSIAFAYGDETDEWPGQPIELYSTVVEFRGRRTDGIRIRVPHAAKQNAPVPKAPAPAHQDLDDEIPF
jgi:hypothetical protein